MTADLSRQGADAVVATWEAMGRCEEEFGPRSKFCGEYADVLDSAIAVLAALQAGSGDPMAGMVDIDIRGTDGFDRAGSGEQRNHDDDAGRGPNVDDAEGRSPGHATTPSGPRRASHDDRAGSGDSEPTCIELHPELPRTTVNGRLIVCGTYTAGLPCWKRPVGTRRCEKCALIEMLAAAPSPHDETLRKALIEARAAVVRAHKIPWDNERRPIEQAALDKIDAALAAARPAATKQGDE